jgi:predicted transposase/invertase (TIGR01784 family)
MDPGIPHPLRNLAVQIQRLYLDELEQSGSLAFEVLGLIVTPETRLRERVAVLVPRIQDENLEPDRKGKLLDVLDTILVSRFSSLTRQEIEAMLSIPSLRNTRVVQDAIEEGRVEGREEGRVEGREEGRVEGREETKREMVMKLVALGVALEIVAQAAELSFEQVQAILNSQPQEE